MEGYYMMVCNKCNNRITLLSRLKGFIKLKYIIHYVPCEIKCETCNTIYKIENEKGIKNIRSFMYFLFLCYLYTSFKFGTLQNLIILIIGCCLINPISNLIISYFGKYKEQQNNQ